MTARLVTVIGYDGSPLPERARRRLAAAELVLGGERHLAAVETPPGARLVPLSGDLGRALSAVRDCQGEAVVLASGDPGFFGILRAVTDVYVGGRVEVIPAVSSVAQAFARAGHRWDDAAVVSAHGRVLGPAVNACRALPKVAVLTGPRAGPAEIGAALAGWDRRLVVAERLGEPDERLVTCTPAEAAGRRWCEPNVVLCFDERRFGTAMRWDNQPAGAPGAWGRHEDEFRHRDSMVTKWEVRAVVLSRLRPAVGTLVWDVGAGSGSVGVECAQFGAAVIAVERDPESCDRVAGNARDRGVDVRVVRGAAPEALLGLPKPDAVFVGGGGPDVVAACAATGARRVVVTLAALDRFDPTARALADAGYAVDGVQLQSARLAPLPDGSHRLAATNPVLVLWGEQP